jgi:hypothetical protein
MGHHSKVVKINEKDERSQFFGFKSICGIRHVYYLFIYSFLHIYLLFIINIYFFVNPQMQNSENGRKAIFPPSGKWLVYRGPFLTSPLGANFDPRGEFVPQGLNFVP